MRVLLGDYQRTGTRASGREAKSDKRKLDSAELQLEFNGLSAAGPGGPCGLDGHEAGGCGGSVLEGLPMD